MCQCSTVQKSEDQRSRHAKKATHNGAFFPIESVMIKDFQSEKKFPYGSVFLLLLCVEKIPIFQGYWR